eukprot:152415-Rhodomonas_salina.2
MIHPSLSLEVGVYVLEHVKMLSAVHDRAELYEGLALERAIHEYRTQCLPQLDSNLRMQDQQLSLPTLNICWVRYLHKLDPAAYGKDCITAFGKVLVLPDSLNCFNPFEFDIDSGHLRENLISTRTSHDVGEQDGGGTEGGAGGEEGEGKEAGDAGEGEAGENVAQQQQQVGAVSAWCGGLGRSCCLGRCACANNFPAARERT